MSQYSDALGAAQIAILEAIKKNINTDSAETIKHLAEAHAWLMSPDQPH